MSKTTGFIVFFVGTAIGSAITWQYLKKKYEQIAQDEIESVKDTFSKKVKKSKINESYSEEQVTENKKETKINSNSYVKDIKSKPYVISPEEFGEIKEYEKISLSYYADQVLADEDDELVEDVENVVGIESLTHFGEYEDDSVFVRNDRLKCDYEILMDYRVYSDVIKTKPHHTEAK